MNSPAAFLCCSVGDMYKAQEHDEEEPEWVKTEREQFSEFRDKNKDGKMDMAETKDWILPSDYDHAVSEAKHLVHESDSDKVCYPYTTLSCYLGQTLSAN